MYIWDSFLYIYGNFTVLNRGVIIRMLEYYKLVIEMRVCTRGNGSDIFERSAVWV